MISSATVSAKKPMLTYAFMSKNALLILARFPLPTIDVAFVETPDRQVGAADEPQHVAQLVGGRGSDEAGPAEMSRERRHHQSGVVEQPDRAGGERCHCVPLRRTSEERDRHGLGSGDSVGR